MAISLHQPVHYTFYLNSRYSPSPSQENLNRSIREDTLDIVCGIFNIHVSAEEEGSSSVRLLKTSYCRKAVIAGLVQLMHVYGGPSLLQVRLVVLRLSELSTDSPEVVNSYFILKESMEVVVVVAL